MKKFILILLFNCTLVSFGQNKTIKIKKEIKQTEVNLTVTLCGKYYGSIKAADLFENYQLKTSNNQLNLKIVSFELSYTLQGTIYMNSCLHDTIPKSIRFSLVNLPKKSRIFIEGIKAVYNKQDTLYLNPIILKTEQ